MKTSLLMVVQPLLDAGKMASGAAGKNQGNDGGNPFQALLNGQITAQERDKRITAAPAETKEAAKQPSSASNENQAAPNDAGAKESVKEGATMEASRQETMEKTVAAEEAAVLAQIMATAATAVAGAQMVPVEPVPGDEVTALMEESGLSAIGEEGASGGRKRLAAGDDVMDSVAGRAVQEGTDDAVLGRVQADSAQNVKATAEKPVVEVDTNMAATLKPVADQSTVQAPQAQQPVPTMSTQQMQQATVAPMTVEVNPAAARVMQQLGTPEWNQAIGQRVLWMIGQEQQSASLTLNPPELGPVRVVVSVSNNNASASFFSSSPDVRHALEGSLPRLREMMEGAGIQLGQAQVGAENQGNSQAGQAPSSGGRAAGVAGDDGDAGSTAAVTGVPAPRQIITKGLVDTFA